jgi:hypothetical protein
MAAARKRHYTGERPFIVCGRPLLSLAHSGQMMLPSLSLAQTTCDSTYLVSLFCSASAIVIANTLPSKLQKLAGS